MKLIVCGGRNYNDRAAAFAALDAVHAKRPITCVIEGGCTGADALAKEWSASRRVPHVAVPANWDTHGKAAGPLRNAEMLRMGADGVLALPGHAGTADMVRQAKAAGVAVWQPYG